MTINIYFKSGRKCEIVDPSPAFISALKNTLEKWRVSNALQAVMAFEDGSFITLSEVEQVEIIDQPATRHGEERKV